MATKTDINNVILEGKEIVTSVSWSQEGLDTIYAGAQDFLQVIIDTRDTENIESDVYKIVSRVAEIIAEIGQEAYDQLRAEAEANLP